MKLTPEQLPAHLERELKPCYAVAGDDPLLSLEATDALRDAARSRGCGERASFRVEPGLRWEEVVEAAAGGSLFSALRLIEIVMPTGRPGPEGAAVLESLLGEPGSDAIIVLFLPRPDKKIREAAWFGALMRRGALVEANPLGVAELPAWIRRRLAAQGQEIGSEALDLLVRRVEGNTLAAHQEILKLGLLYPAGKLDFRQVEASVLDVARYDPFQLPEALLTGDTARFARILDGLRAEGVAPPLILWALVQELRVLLALHQAKALGRPLDAVFRQARAWGPRQGLLQRALGRVRVVALEAALRQAAAIDRMIKGLETGNVWDGLRELGLGLRLKKLGGE
jgi:DNA polymerase-3 subunit delta